MNLREINAEVTPRNREQSEWIVKKLGYTYYPDHDLDAEYKRYDGTAVAWKGPMDCMRLPNGSFTLCWIVGTLKDHGWRFHPRDVGNLKGGYWMKRRADMVWQDLGYVKDVHSLTENADSLIRLLEKKL